MRYGPRTVCSECSVRSPIPGSSLCQDCSDKEAAEDARSAAPSRPPVLLLASSTQAQSVASGDDRAHAEATTSSTQLTLFGPGESGATGSMRRGRKRAA